MPGMPGSLPAGEVHTLARSTAARFTLARSTSARTFQPGSPQQCPPGPLQPGPPGPPHQVHLPQVRPTATGVHLQRVEARITTHSTWNAVQPLGSWAACRRAGWGSWIGDGSLKVGLPGYVGRHYAVLSRALLDPGDTPAPCPLNPLNPLTLFASSSVHLRGGSRSVHRGGGRSVRRGGGRSVHRGGGRSVRRQQYTMGDMAGRSSP